MSYRKTLANVMSNSRLICLAPETTVAVASKKMLERGVSAVLVSEDGKLSGIVTEQDITFRVVAFGRDPQSVRLCEIMSRHPDTLPRSANVVEALDIMQTHGYRHVPVEDGGRIIGMISLTDLFAEVRRELVTDIRDREEFMFGSGYSVPLAAN